MLGGDPGNALVNIALYVSPCVHALNVRSIVIHLIGQGIQLIVRL
jgi:hypothetical protein